MRALITGSAGFAGSHLCGFLAEQTDWDIFAVCFHSCPKENLEIVRATGTALQGDLLEAQWVADTIAQVRPDYVFHLAALSAPAASFADPARTFTNNVLAQVNLFLGILQTETQPVILVVGSGDEYGLVRPDEIPVTENTPLRPTNPYAVSKLAQDYLGLQYFLSHGLRVVRVRPFNHIGPRQAPGFVTTDFARQIAEIEAGQCPAVVRVGNLGARRQLDEFGRFLVYLGMEAERLRFAWIDLDERGRIQQELADLEEQVSAIGPAQRLATRAPAVTGVAL